MWRALASSKTFNLLGERSAELTDNFARSRKVSIEFEESQAPWMRALYLVCGLGSVLIIPPVTLALWPWAALHHLPAGCLALRL